MSLPVTRPDEAQTVAELKERIRILEAVSIEADFTPIDSDTITWDCSPAGCVANLKPLDADNAVPMNTLELHGEGESGPPDTEAAITPQEFLNGYVTTSAAGYELQARGIWQVDSFVSKVGLLYWVDLPGGAPAGNIELATFSPVQTISATRYTPWLPVQPSTASDAMYFAAYAGNDSGFFGWAMDESSVQFRWVKQGSAWTEADAQVIQAATLGAIPGWDVEDEVYRPTEAVLAYNEHDTGTRFLGFYGQTPIVRPVIPATPNAQDIADVLVALGLATQAP